MLSRDREVTALGYGQVAANDFGIFLAPVENGSLDPDFGTDGAAGIASERVFGEPGTAAAVDRHRLVVLLYEDNEGTYELARLWH